MYCTRTVARVPTLCLLTIGVSTVVPVTGAEAPAAPTTPPAPAEPNQPLELSADDAENIARERAPSVMAAKSNVMAAQGDARALSSFEYPQISADGSWLYGEDKTFGVGITDGPDDRPSVNANIEQFIFGFGRHTAADDQREGTIGASMSDLARVRRDAGLDARLAFAQVQQAISSRDISQERVEQRSEELLDSQRRFEVGAVTRVDVNTAQIDLEIAKNDLRQSEASIGTALAELRRTLGFEPKDPLISVTDPLTRPVDRDALLAAAALNIAVGPEIDVQKSVAQLQEGNARDAHATLWPQLYGIGHAGYLESNLPNGEDVDWSVGLSLRWNLYGGGLQYAQARAAEGRRAEAMANVTAIIQQRQTILAATQEQLRALNDQINRQERIVTLSDQNYEDARLQYNEGTITQTTLGTISLQVAEAKFQLADLIFNEIVQTIELRRLAAITTDNDDL